MLIFFGKCMECSMAQYLLKGMKLLENFSFEELHRARFIKAYGVLKIINSVKHSIMQISFFYDGVLHKATFINEYGVLKLSIVNKIHDVLFFICKRARASVLQRYYCANVFVIKRGIVCVRPISRP